MTFAFLLILVVLAVSCYYCTHRIDLNNLNREFGVLITNDAYDIVWSTSYEIDPIKSIGKVAKENLHTMTEELKAFEQERKRRKATES